MLFYDFYENVPTLANQKLALKNPDQEKHSPPPLPPPGVKRIQLDSTQ
jgi:hypothetical protein